jgi:UDP-glucose 4-epimerase
MVAAGTAPKINNMVINVGSGQSTSVKEMVKKVLEITGGKPQVISNPRAEGGISFLKADIGLAAKKLNYKPSIDLETGLRLTLERDPHFHTTDNADIERRR